MDRAVKITPETLDIITEVNDGITPKIEDNTCYFVTTDDPTKYNQILPENQFLNDFYFVGPELKDQFAEIREL